MPTPTAIALRGAEGITFDEMTDSGGGEVNFNAPAFTKKYLMLGCADETAAVAAVEAELAAGLGILTANDIALSIYSYKVDPVADGDGTVWIATLNYRFSVDYFEMSFDTSGATLKVYQAFDEGAYYDCADGGEVDPGADFDDGVVPDFNGLIGVSGDSVEGVEVPLRKWDFTILIRQKLTTMPSSFLEDVYDVSGFTNDSPLTLTWQGQDYYFDTEELLFYGAPGKQTSEGDFEMTLKFGVKRSATVEIANSGPIEVQGWRYIWPYAPKTPTSEGFLIPSPEYAIVNQVIPTADLSVIGIFS